MKGESPRRDQPSFMVQGLEKMCNPWDPLYQLADMITSDQVTSGFEGKFAAGGRVGAQSLHAILLGGKGCRLIRSFGLYSFRTQGKWPDKPHVFRLAPAGWKKE